MSRNKTQDGILERTSKIYYNHLKSYAFLGIINNWSCDIYRGNFTNQFSSSQSIFKH